uniref:AlNc14C5G729 protein n=1 Tax=Albugo laibachii Nc14 TaxID=890382 RepID=F0W0U4_9STRA|nr:AlNc14C5G729 [Albugo laibachii Nc14]|eukprot:CCA14668.1 AlNc14C5G729 [Albugo laibachii Nc14]
MYTYTFVHESATIALLSLVTLILVTAFLSKCTCELIAFQPTAQLHQQYPQLTMTRVTGHTQSIIIVYPVRYRNYDKVQGEKSENLRTLSRAFEQLFNI